jgi:uncharacterized protein YaaQ
MTDRAVPQKLVMAIVTPNDGERLMQALVRAGFPATRTGSAGGFLRRGNVTIFSGVPAGDVERVLAIIRSACPVRTEMAPVQTLPLVGAAASGPPVEVRTGGAVVFVLDVERFERI